MLLGKREVQFVVIASKGESASRWWSEGVDPSLTLSATQPRCRSLLSRRQMDRTTRRSRWRSLTRSKDEAKHKKLFEQVVQTIGEGVRIALPS